ncbi:MAG: DNA mismatch repair protein MutS, partial [Candidatus Bipolaricaulota bacterium]
MPERTPMMDQYWRIKADHPDAILFFHLGDFYEAFFDDAEVLAREMDVVLTQRNGHPMAGVPVRRGETYINGLLRRGYKVAVCRQVEDARKASGLVKREVVRVVTPGTAIEESLLDAGENNYLASVFPASIEGPFGLALLDVSTGEFSCTTAADRASLAAELARRAPSELLLPEGSEALSARFEGVSITTRTREEYDASRVEPKALGFSEDALRAAGAVLEYVEETQRTLLPHIRPPERYEIERQMELDAFTIASLELVATLRDGARRGTLLGALNGTTTPMGRRLLRRWILAPSTDVAVIESRLDAVAALHERPMLRQELRADLKEIHDLERLVGRLGSRRMAPPQLLQLERTLAAIPRVAAAVRAPWDGREEEIPAALAAVRREIDEADLPSLCTPLAGMLVEQPPADVRDGGVIRDGFDDELDRLRAKGRSLRDRIAALEAREKERTGIPSLKVGYNRVFGYYIEVTNTHAAKVPASYIRKQTLKNCERYITPELKDYENRVLHA